MGVGGVWNRALVYFGILEEEDYWDDEAYEAEQELERTYTDSPHVRRLPSRPRDPEVDDGPHPGPERPPAPRSARAPAPRPAPRGRPSLEAVSSAVKLH